MQHNCIAFFACFLSFVCLFWVVGILVPFIKHNHRVRWATVKAGTQERRNVERNAERKKDAQYTGNEKYPMMNAHAHIVKAHMVIGATVKSTRLVCRFRHNSQVCLSVCQFRTLKNDQV